MSSRTITTDVVGRSEVLPVLATVEARLVDDGDTLSDVRAIAQRRSKS